VKKELSTAAATTAKAQEENAKVAASTDASGEDAELSNLLKLFGAGSDFEKVLDEAFKDVDLNDMMSKLGVSGEPGKQDADMEALLKMLSEGGGADPNAGPNFDPKVLEQIASKLENTMGNEQMDQMFESMFKSVMKKEIMYEPIKAITDEYPKYLQRKDIPSEDRSRYESQFSAYRALRQIYESDDPNLDQVVQIMQDLERFGQPPPEISKLLGAGAPGAPGAPGLPEGMNPNQCPTQ
jgi:peroxin-19